jgi:hypothetical protein
MFCRRPFIGLSAPGYFPRLMIFRQIFDRTQKQSKPNPAAASSVQAFDRALPYRDNRFAALPFTGVLQC